MLPAFNSLNAMLAPPVLERFTLLANHVLASEPVATQRLAPHAGKSISIAWRGWPSLLPPPLPVSWTITPAGLLDWRGLPPDGVAPAAELTMTIDAGRPAQLLSQLLAFWFFLTPVLYSRAMLPEFAQRLMDLNPLTYYPERLRGLILESQYALGTQDLVALLTAVAMLGVGAFVFTRLRRHFEDFL
jgi:hypothetical protein